MTAEAFTWSELHARALAALGTPREARWLVEEASGASWPVCAADPVLRLPARRFDEMLRRRLAGEPLQYVLGRWAFRSLDLMVDRRVLIPRPETEAVVGIALRELDSLGVPSPVVADLGTGSGAIALSFAAERPDATVWATDSSAAALEVAAANLAGLGSRSGARVHLCRGDWWDALPPDLAGRIDLAVSNPPYVAAAELADLEPSVAEWEPIDALVAGPEGTEALAAVLRGSCRWLAPGGVFVVELDPRQVGAVRRMAERAGFAEAEPEEDLAGRQRAVVARRRRQAVRR